MGIIPEMRKKVCLGFALFSAELKQSTTQVRLTWWGFDLVRRYTGLP
jgi:hypothetical protein